MSTNSGKTILTILLAIGTLFVGLNYLTGADSSLLPLLIVLLVATVGFAGWIWSDENRSHRADSPSDALTRADEAARAAEIAAAEARQKAEQAANAHPEPNGHAKAETKAPPKPAAETAAKPAAEPKQEAPAAAAEPDDLSRVEGIGPKYAQALVAAGLGTYAKLASASLDDIRAAAKAGGLRNTASMETWSQQAGLAAKGDWAALDKLQDKLKGGRKS